MRNVSDKVVEKVKTHSLCSITFFRKSCLWEIMWKNMAQPDRIQTIIQYSAGYRHTLRTAM